MADIGYARVSTGEQDTDSQVDRLKAAGCTRVYVDHGASGAKASRPGWDKCLERLEAGDVLKFTKLDRIGRSVTNLHAVMRLLGERGVEFAALDQPIDTTTAMGKMLFGILSVFAEFERDLIIERTREGLNKPGAARGHNGGRKARLSGTQREMAARLKADGHSVTEIGVLLGNGKPVSRRTVYRALGMSSDSPAVSPPG
jgi:DNA invertase Pin-like site-specific DNA recombinase